MVAPLFIILQHNNANANAVRAIVLLILLLSDYCGVLQASLFAVNGLPDWGWLSLQRDNDRTLVSHKEIDSF